MATASLFSGRHLMMPWQHFGRTSSLCCEAAALNPDAPRGLYVLHVFAAATGWTQSILLSTSLDSRVQIRHCCTRQTISELLRGLIVVFAPVIGFTCADPAFLPPSSFIDIVPNCGPNCGKSPLSSGGFAIRCGLCRCSARRIAR